MITCDQNNDGNTQDGENRVGVEARIHRVPGKASLWRSHLSQDQKMNNSQCVCEN